ncbi:MAG TPA: transposase, partial [Pseudomonas sp.]|nr:transposase [Pseudomonas sp.]
GRSCYDRGAKRELIEASLRPGVSVAGMALRHGINANLLRTWIRRYRLGRDERLAAGGPAAPAQLSAPAFVPVVPAKSAVKAGRSRMEALLPNGVRLDLSQVVPDELPGILRLFCELPCSGPTPG